MSVPLRNEPSARVKLSFFLSEFAVHAGQVDQARELLKGVVTGCKLFDVVYSAALAELNLLSK